MNSKLVSLQRRKKCFSSELAEFALKTKLGAVRAAQGGGKGQHQQKMSSLSRLGAECSLSCSLTAKTNPTQLTQTLPPSQLIKS